MDIASEHFLTGARRATDENRDVGTRHARGQREQLRGKRIAVDDRTGGCLGMDIRVVHGL